MKAKPFHIPSLRAAFFILSGVIFFTHPIAAQTSSFRGNEPELGSQSSVVMDAATGTFIFYKNPDDEIPPASLTKLMTMHLVFKEIAAGRASLDEIISPTRESWAINQPPGSSLMNIANGQSLSLKDLLLGMAVFSGNDAAAAAALRFAPSQNEFVEMMNREAQALGFEKTYFYDSAGYWEFNMTTASEFAQFCRLYLEAHPESLREYHSVPNFSYPRAENVAERYRENPGTRLHRNHNNLLGRVEGVDGFKTGYIPEAGYNIALTAERDGTRFIAVILGAPAERGGDRIRDDDGMKIIEWSFANYKTFRPQVDFPEPFRVWKGKVNYVNTIWDVPLEFTVPAERGEDFFWNIEREDPLMAPLPSGSHIGDLVLYDSLGELRRLPLLTTEEISEGGFFKRLFDSIRLFLKRFSKKE